MVSFYDTNALLSLTQNAFNSYFLCSHETLKEIESIKTSSRKDEDTKYRARKLARLFDENNSYKVCNYRQKDIEALLNSAGVELSPDAIIVAEAAMANAEQPDGILFISDDISCKNIARNIFGLNVGSPDSVARDIYKGYSMIEGTTEEINQKMEILDYSKLYPNEYIIIHNTTDDKWSEMRYNGTVLTALRLPPSNFIKGRNSLQRCALDALYNKDIDIVSVLGTYGSGRMIA